MHSQLHRDLVEIMEEKTIIEIDIHFSCLIMSHSYHDTSVFTFFGDVFYSISIEIDYQLEWLEINRHVTPTTKAKAPPHNRIFYQSRPNGVKLLEVLNIFVDINNQAFE